MPDDFHRALVQDLNAGLADAEDQITALENAGPDDIDTVLRIMERALDDDADPRLVAGVAALRRITTFG